MVSWKNVLGTSVLSAGLILGSFTALGTPASANSSNTKSLAMMPEPIKTPTANFSSGGPFDPGLVNEDVLLQSLIKQKVISKNASQKQQLSQLQNYIANRAKEASEMAKNNSNDFTKGKSIKYKPIKKADMSKTKNAGKTKNLKNNSVSPVEKENWNGPVRKDKVLVLLIDFPDYPFDAIDQDKNDPNFTLNVDDYSREHYQRMLFGKNGYEGPDGQNFVSFKQFYEKQSGGSYTVDGTVGGWYHAKHPAAYYGGHDSRGGNDINPRELIYEALQDAAKDPNINLADYDIEDPDDWNGDGNTREPDGIIDHLMVIHSGMGEEAGGGILGDDAIWSHSWDLGGYITIPGTHSDTTKERFGVDSLLGYKYTVQPEDGAAGVFSHEYGHNLGLPDEYDIQYTHDSVGEPVGYWSIMSSGSWGGLIPGTEPPGFSPYDKEYLQSTMPELNWFKDTVYDLKDLKNGKTISLDAAAIKGTNADAVRINLPDKATSINKPASGDYEYWGGNGDETSHTMKTSVDLTDATKAKLDYDIWYNTEEGWDFGMIQVSEDGGKTWTSLSTSLTTDVIDPDGYPDIVDNLPGYTGSSNGWQHESIDLSAYAGKEIQIQFRSMTDWATSLDGIFVDNIKVDKDGQAILTDDAEGNSAFELDGFSKSDGKKYTENYYLLEWRSWSDVDVALSHIKRGNSVLTYDPGLVVWYVDKTYDDRDNLVGNHPGNGFLGVVDAHQKVANWSDSNIKDGVDGYGPASTMYQIQDAAFSLNKTDKTYLDYKDIAGRYLKFGSQPAVPVFDDSRDYSNPGQIYAGRDIPQHGLKVHVTGQADDMSVGTIYLHTDANNSKMDLDKLKQTVYSNQKDHNVVDISGSLHVDGTGNNAKMTYDLVDSEGKVIKTENDTVVGTYQTFNHAFSLPDNVNTGDYTIKVTAKVKGSKKVTSSLKIKVDNEAPVITLKGDNPLKWEQGKDFEDPGFTASDNLDGDLTKSVKVSGYLDVDEVGKYTLTYSVTDKAGNKTSVTRTVKVIKKKADDGGTGTDNDGGTNTGGTTDNGGTTNGGGTSHVDGGNLPSTATDMFNWITAGAIALALSAAMLYAQRRRKRLI